MIKSFWLQSACWVLGASAGVAHAQDMSASSAQVTGGQLADDTNMDIVVTAQRRSQRLVDVPVSVTAIGADLLEKTSATNLLSIAKTTPGVVIVSFGAYVQPTIRGIGTLLTGPGADPNVAVYLDGVYQPSQSGNVFDLPSVEQVEILKGPQGTLFGRNATGGAILITTADPEFETSGKVSAAYGRFNEARATAYITTPLSENIATNLSAYYRRSDGWIHDLRTNDLRNKQESFDLRWKTLLRFSDRFKLVTTAAYNETSDPTGLAFVAAGGNTVGNRNQPPANPNAGPVATTRDFISHNLPPKLRVKTWALSGKATLDFDFATLTSISAYRHENAKAASDGDASYAGATGGFLSGSYVENVYPQWFRDFTQEFNLTSSGSSPLQWVAGAFYIHEAAGHKYTTNNLRNFQAKLTTDAYAAFIDGTYKIGLLSIIAGLRYNNETKHKLYGAGTFASYNVNAQATFRSWTPRFGLSYALAGRTNIYGTYSKGFKSGTFNALGPASTPVQPEKVDAFELGFKTAGPVLSFNAAGFYYLYDNIQVNAFDYNQGVALLFNAARAKIYGFDADIAARISSAFEVRGAFAYTHARYSSFPGAVVFFPRPGGLTGNLTAIADASGNEMLRAPKVTISGTATYRVPLAHGEIEGSVTPYYSSRVNYSFDERITQAPYVTVDAILSWKPNNQIRLSVYGRNLTDKIYASNRSASSTRDSVVFAPPRTYGLSASYSF